MMKEFIQKSTVLKKEQAKEMVVEFTPHFISVPTPGAALDYLKTKAVGTDFTMSEAIKKQTGVEEIERASEEKRIEELVVDRLKSIQESAYQEAYQLGLSEGREEAIRQSMASFEEKMDHLSQSLSLIENIKLELVKQNEAHLVQLMFHMASRLAFEHVKQNPESIIPVMHTAVQLAQEDEKVVVRLNPEQIAFIEELKKNTKREFEFLKHIELVADVEVQFGGCIIETNYGQVDARLEERVAKLWETLESALPKVTSSNGSPEGT